MTAPALTLHRVRAGAPFTTKGALEAALGWWREGAGDEGEWLLVPRLQVIALPAASSTPGAFARQLDRALAAVRERATVDPAPGTWPRGALRFTRRERWLAWLALRLTSPAQAVPQGCAPLPDPLPVMRAQLQALLASDPLVLPALARNLLAAGEFAIWVSAWSAADIAVIAEALTVHFAVPPALLIFAQHGAGDDAEHAAAIGAALAGMDNQRHPQTPADRTASRIIADVHRSPAMAAVEPERSALALLVAAVGKAPALAPWLAAASLRAAREATPLPEMAAAPPPAPFVPSDRTLESDVTLAPHTTPADADPSVPSLAPMAGPQLRRQGPLGAGVRRASASTRIAPGPTGHASASQPAPRPLPPARPPLDLCDTGFAGLMFLFNAFTALDLYPDFTRPLDPRLAPSPSWLLERIGLAWFGRGFARDPLRDWLAARAVTGALPPRWKVNPAWDGPAPRRRLVRHGRHAFTWDQRGFLAAVRPLGTRDRDLPEAPDRVARALRRLPLAAEPWLAGLLSYLDWRLRQAGVRAADLRLPGTLRSGATEDEILLSIPLDQLPIALRIAGLDRDPGWVPAEGCNVRFTFA